MANNDLVKVRISVKVFSNPSKPSTDTVEVGLGEGHLEAINESQFKEQSIDAIFGPAFRDAVAIAVAKHFEGKE